MKLEDVAAVLRALNEADAPVLQYSELIRLKRAAGRRQYLADIDQLELMSRKSDKSLK